MGSTSRLSCSRERSVRASRGRGTLRFNEARQRYQAIIVIDGKKHTRSTLTKREAEKALDALRKQAEAGTQPTRETTEAFLRRWLEFVAPPATERSTWKGYESKVRLYLIPHIGKIPLERLGPQHLDQAFRAMSRQGLAAATVGQTRRIAHAAMQQAIYWRLISQNPVSMTRAPRAERRERNPLSPDEALTFLDFVQGDRWEALWTLAACLGLRQGEILGLRWGDVLAVPGEVAPQGHSLNTPVTPRQGNQPVYAGPPRRGEGSRPLESIIHVRGALKFGQLGTTKTKQERTIPLPDFAVKSLSRHRQIQTFASRNPVWDNRLDLVFTREDGHPLNGTVVTHRLYKLLDAAGLRRTSFHDLRHCAASLLIARGVNAKQVMSILGHAHLDMTLSRYAHTTDEGLRHAADALEQWRAQ